MNVLNEKLSSHSTKRLVVEHKWYHAWRVSSSLHVQKPDTDSRQIVAATKYVVPTQLSINFQRKSELVALLVTFLFNSCMLSIYVVLEFVLYMPDIIVPGRNTTNKKIKQSTLIHERILVQGKIRKRT